MDPPRDIGYSLKRQRCYAKRDWYARGRVNAIGAITNFKLLNICLFDTYINADIFYAWLTQELLPNMPSHAIIVLDNVTFHRRKDAQIATEQQGHTLEFLPSYSRFKSNKERVGTKVYSKL